MSAVPMLAPLPAVPALDSTTQAVVRLLKTRPDALDEQAIEESETLAEEEKASALRSGKSMAEAEKLAAEARDATRSLGKLSLANRRFREVCAICWEMLQPAENRHRLFLPEYKPMNEIRAFEEEFAWTSETKTWRWIEVWVLEALRPYEGMSDAEIDECAQRGDFKDLAENCRDALNEEQKRRRNERTVTLRGRRGKVREISEYQKPLLQIVAAKTPGPPSPLEMPVSLDDRMKAVKTIVKAHEQELRRMDVLDGLRASISNAELIDKPNAFDIAVIADIQKRRQYSTARQAKAYREQFSRTMYSQLNRGNPLVRAIEIEMQPPKPVVTELPQPKPFFTEMGKEVDDVEVAA